MKTKNLLNLGGMLAVLSMGLPNVWAAPKAASKTKVEPSVSLSAEGQAYADQLQAQLAKLKSEIEAGLPKIDESKKTAFMKAYETEVGASVAELKALRAGGDKKVADKNAAQTQHEAAETALAQATKDALAPTKAMIADVQGFLTSDKLDAPLVKYTVISEATPHGLAEFAQQGKEQRALVDQLLGDDTLMKEMLVAGGAQGGKYGQAMQIYTAIQKASPKASEGLFHRLALGTSLEHAVPVEQSNPEALDDAPATVDPVKRYMHYEKAYLAGDLDAGFKDLSTWEYRMTVNGNEPDDVLVWGRDMLRNYRPDEIDTPDTRWRYVKSVKTEVKYGSQDQVNDLPSLQQYQNIIKTGGVCGRRAFFGRFILRSFGVPTLARPQKGHATLVHWTPQGWVINLGASWGWGWIKSGQEDVDFLADTQARKDPNGYLQVQRAQWVGGVLGETKSFGFHDAVSGFWNGVAIYKARAVADASKSVALEAVGQDIGEANVSKEKDVVVKVEIPESAKQIVSGQDGVITIPAVACTVVPAGSAKIVFMKSVPSGFQLHYSRIGDPATFDYTVDVPAAGNYVLEAKVVTVSSDQHLLVAVNDAKEPIDIAVPYTIGKWDQTPPVQLALTKGKNVLHFSRIEPVKGLTIKELTLKPGTL